MLVYVVRQPNLAFGAANQELPFGFCWLLPPRSSLPGFAPHVCNLELWNAT
jgi:hypothetical protein